MSTTAGPLSDLLAAEHAVIYGYGVAGAWLRGAERRRALRQRDRHRVRRDELLTRLESLGDEHSQPAPAYSLPAPVDSPAAARDLLAVLEQRLAAVWADAVAGLDGDERLAAVAGLQDAAVAAVQWGAASAAFPGLAERA